MLRTYQTELLNGVKTILKTSPIACIAAGTGSGKTEIATQLIKDNPKKRFLILAHGQKEIRANFYDRLLSHGVEAYELSVCNLKTVAKTNAARVVVSLPYTMHNYLDNLTKFDYVIVDEAHQLFESRSDHQAKMYPKIRAWHKGKTLLLTASHYGLAAVTKEQKVFFSREQGFEQYAIQDVRMCRRVVKGAHVTDEDFSKAGELNKDVHISSMSAVKEFLKAEYYPMIISVRRREEADEVMAALPKRTRALVSHGSNDVDASNIVAFKAGKADVCIVVNRAQLGFDFAGLKTFVDATYTKNVTRIEQMVGRLVRKADIGEKKFIKLSLSHMQDEYALICTAVLALGATDLYTTWNGEYRNLAVKVPRHPSSGGAGIGSAGDDARGPSVDTKRLATLELTFGEYKEQFALIEPISLYEAICILKGFQIKDPEGHKEALINLAKSGALRPRDLRVAARLSGYIGINSSSYDPQFAAKIRSIRPDWFEGAGHRVGGVKSELLNLAKSGADRPSQRSGNMGKKLSAYLCKGHKSYDPDFHEVLKSVAPKWFLTNSDICKLNKSLVWGMLDRPKYYSKLGVLLAAWTSKSHMNYDPEFDAQIRALRPDWFRK